MLITGHRGFIGSYLTKRLDGIGIDRKEGKNLIDCELPDTDIIIHLAAQTSVVDSISEPMQDARDNILVTLRLIKRYPKAKFIFASSGGAIQETIESPYGLSKVTCEKYLEMLHDNYVILRFPNVFGSGGKGVIEKFIEGEPIVYGNGEATRNYVHVEDIVEGIIKSLNWCKGTYFLGGGTQATVNDLAKATGKKIKYDKARIGELKKSFLENTTPDWKPTINAIDYVKSSCANDSI